MNRINLQYLIRLDDACPTMDKKKWGKIEEILDEYGIKPMVGIVPDCKDENLKIENPDPDFWEKARMWQQKGWSIALHGYDHRYISKEGLNGLNPLWERSEFAGVSLKTQKEKVSKGIAILKEQSIIPKYFFAPSHTFDFNTLTALREESDIRIISDTIATKPYKMYGFSFIPQIGGHCSEMKLPGIWTFCLHPNTMTDENIAQTKSFISDHICSFKSFDQLVLDDLKNKDMFSRFMSWMYFTRRKLKGIK